jgi:S1-C subfamily serine protease
VIWRAGLTAAIVCATGLAVPAAAEPSLADVFARVDPSVVEIHTTQTAPTGQGQTRWVTGRSLGSGFLISGDGKIMTAAHVVQTADAIEVQYVDGQVSAATILASDPAADVALIVAEQVPEGIEPLVLADSDAVRVGEQVFVIGAPLGVSHTLTVGYISARRANDKVLSGLMPVDLLQTDAAINTGNSGGPMFNMRGEVIGVVSRIISRTGGSEGLGFVVTSNLAREVVLERPTMWSGLEGQVLSGELAQAFNVPQAAGVLVQRVATGSPASLLGLRPGTIQAQVGDTVMLIGGDIILEVQGIAVGDPEDELRIREALEALGADDVLEVTVLRAGQRLTLRKMGYLLAR